MKTNTTLALAALVAAGLAPDAHAEVRLSGFGQVVAGKALGSSGAFPSLGYGNDLDFADESLFGIQITAPLNERVSATAQIVAKGNDDFDADLAWAYANITLSDSFELKVGRQRTPFFRYSDYKDVGYAYAWMRAPVAMYSLAFDNMDAATLTHTVQLGNWNSRTTGFVGSYTGTVPVSGVATKSEFKNFTGLAWDGNYNDWLTLRIAYMRADVGASQAQLEQVLGTMRQLGLATAADLVAAEDDKGTFLGYGFEIDRNDWLVQGEYSYVGVDDSLFSHSRNWYLSVAHRFGTFTPYVVYGERHSDPDLSALAHIPAGHPLYAPVAGALRRAATLDDTYASVGVRWDFARNIAFKADYSRFSSDVAWRDTSKIVSLGVAFTF